MQQSQKSFKKVLLHICCATCAITCIERLKKRGFKVSGVFYNPNIHPEEEYLKRKANLVLVSDTFKLPLIDSNYDSKEWFDFIKGYENDAEGGKRCQLCFEIRLRKTYELVLKENFDFFTTTLTISPHKDSLAINQIGSLIGGKKFLAEDFKKQSGFIEAIKASKQMGLYRQNYCGCIFSKRNNKS
ncbi:MAG: epoxyqueuosine reductase QueH [Candidatus Omnitrophica bacterium]|jgi:predicted adenine nucleotide alpha hydrolase (AANH) superfamily ATPase|nr:epoxyqueuosine reductase QueH [Candidatus Omnitrophota bacterium]